MSESYAVPLPLTVTQVAVGLLLPVLAGLAPVLRGTRITTQQALNDVGVGGGNDGRGLIERLLGQLQKMLAIKRPVLLAIRNTLRHKGRLVQTLVVLIFGTALFVSVISVRASVDATLDSFMRFHRYDVSVEMSRPELVARLEQAAREVPGVVDARGVVERAGDPRARRRYQEQPVQGRRRAADTDFHGAGDDRGRVAAWTSSRLMHPVITAWWSTRIWSTTSRTSGWARDVVLDIDGREATWHVVGIVPTESRGPAVYVPRDDYAYATRTPGQGTRCRSGRIATTRPRKTRWRRGC